MNRILMLAGLLPCALANSAPFFEHTYESPGWHWYNEMKEEDDAVRLPAPSVPVLSPSEQKARLQQATKAALDTAILYPTPENFRRYMLLQNFWTSKAGEFSQSAKQAMLMFPELDYNLQFSHYNGAVPAQLQADQQKQKNAIAELAASHGLFFFYRGKEARDRLMAGIVNDFCEEHSLSLIAISIDGVLSPALSRSRRDTGQAQRMGISHFPALFLVDPSQESYQPLAYGFITPDDLSRQFLNVTTGFKPNF